MKEVIIVVIFIGAYILLQMYILPKLGISTWMRDSCQVTDNKNKEPLQSIKKKIDTTGIDCNGNVT